MKLAIKGSALVTVMALSLSLVSGAFAANTEPVLGFAGTETGTVVGVGKSQPLPGIAVTSVVYDNTASPALYAVSSTDLNALWGDRLLTTGTGVLNAQTVSLFNSGSSAGPVLTAVIGVNFYDGVTSTLIGGYQINANFGVGGLPPGFYSLVSVTALDGLGINLNVANIVVVQNVVSFTGTANRLGIVSFDPPTVGSSPTSMYIQASTIGGGVAGFYTFTNGPANPGYKITVTVPTVGVQGTTWGAMKNMYN